MRIYLAITVFLSLACNVGDKFNSVLVDDPSLLYWNLRLNYHAVNLSRHQPLNTVQLMVVPMSYKGDTISAEDAIVSFSSSDSNAVSVTSDGLVVGKQVTGSTRIIAVMKIGHKTHSDTAYVKVVDDPSPQELNTLSILIPPGDSAKFAADKQFSLGAYVVKTSKAGNPMNDILVDYRSRAPDIASVDRTEGTVISGESGRPGQAMLYVSTYAYGVYRKDSISVTVGYPVETQSRFQERAAVDSLGIERFNNNPNSTIGVGGLVIFSNITSDTMDFTFEDTTGIMRMELIPGLDPSVNKPAVSPYDPDDPFGLYRVMWIRVFTQPGEFKWSSKKYGIFGSVLVVDERKESRESTGR